LIYISAQPDEYYFLWQLELQLYNFNLLGISAEQIHILIGFDPKIGLSKDSRDFIQRYPSIGIYGYADTRTSRSYLSSIRPHILKKHFEVFPKLQEETIFYHDSDIVFSKLPDFGSLVEENVWYASDTRDYLDTNYIKSNSSDLLFEEMCGIVGISPELVLKEDVNAGGAQYLMKNCDIAFWEKVEIDCELLYVHIKNRNRGDGFCDKKTKVNSWVTDMWVVWWNTLLRGRQFRTCKELDFSWANSSIEEWDSKTILHYTGHVSMDSKTIFRKSNYSSGSPFYDNFTEINKLSCSYPLVQMISSLNESKEGSRVDLSDVSFLIVVRVDSEDRLENAYAITRYLCNNFNTNVLLMEVDRDQKIDRRALHRDVRYFFKEDTGFKLHRTKYNNELINECTTPYVALYDADVIVPVLQLVEAVELLREGEYTFVHPFDGRCLGTDILLKTVFIKLLDEEFLNANRNKQSLYSRRAVGGCIIVDRQVYLSCGGENEFITSWGPDDVERFKRVKILGHKSKRIKGVLYHLHHSRNDNSGYQHMGETVHLMGEYLKICESRKDILEEYIKSWNWLSTNKTYN
jgi:hypothetical protein